MALPLLRVGAGLFNAGRNAIASGGIKEFAKGSLGIGKGGLAGIAGYVATAELIKHGAINPILGATGMYYSPQPPPPAMMGGGMGMMGGMGQQLSPGQFNNLYGSEGWSLPWQKEPGLYERMQNRQLGAQSRMFDAGQRTQRYGIQMNRELGFDSNKTQLGIAGITAGAQKYLGDRQQRIADFSTSRQLQGLMDSNKTSARIADMTTSRQLNAVYDNNRRDVKIAGIGANRDRYVADRGVEVARWGGSVPRIATFGALMR